MSSPPAPAAKPGIPAHPHFPGGRGAPGEAGSVPRHLGGWKGHRRRCSVTVLPPLLRRGAICRTVCSECAAISGRGFIEKCHLEKGGSRAAAPGSGGFSGKTWSLSSFPATSTGWILGCFAPNSEPVKPVILSSLPPLAGLFRAWGDAQPSHVMPKI